MSHRIVIDTNVYVSRALRGASVPGRAVDRVWSKDVALFSDETRAELYVVLRRPKFAPFLDPETLEQFLAKAKEIAVFVPVESSIHACRDARDDKFLSVAVAGRADAIVTGDTDLLALDPFRGVAILAPGDYLARQ
jgi:putative PIN family toxin of toxin-antitoxin system